MAFWVRESRLVQTRPGVRPNGVHPPLSNSLSSPWNHVTVLLVSCDPRSQFVRRRSSRYITTAPPLLRPDGPRAHRPLILRTFRNWMAVRCAHSQAELVMVMTLATPDALRSNSGDTSLPFPGRVGPNGRCDLGYLHCKCFVNILLI
jgi:hypothetical protein